MEQADHKDDQGNLEHRDGEDKTEIQEQAEVQDHLATTVQVVMQDHQDHQDHQDKEGNLDNQDWMGLVVTKGSLEQAGTQEVEDH